MLELQTSYNPGALWGFGRSFPHSSLIFAGLSILAGLAICYWLFVRRAAASLVLTIALGLIMAGAMGNCYDRLVFGHVRDFVHFHVDSIGFDCAIFNFADNLLIAGAISLVLFALRPEPAQPSRAGYRCRACPAVSRSHPVSRAGERESDVMAAVRCRG